MAKPNPPTIDIDDAEHIRNFSAHIRKTSGHPAFAPARGQSTADRTSPPTNIAPNHANAAPAGYENADGGGGRTLRSSSQGTPSTETGHEELSQYPTPNPEHRLNQLPRAVQQIKDESPQLKGIQAPHPTPESFKPSPLTGVQHLPDPPSNEEIGMAISQVLSSLPNASKGIEDSIWASRGPRSRTSIALTDKDGKLIGLTAHQEKKSYKDEAEARAREKEHNENFERMSFKIAESPWFGRKYTGKPLAQEEKPKEPLSVLDPRLAEQLSAAMKENGAFGKPTEEVANRDPDASSGSDQPRWAPGNTTTKSIFTSTSATPKKVESAKTHSAVPDVSSNHIKRVEYRSIGTQTYDEDFVVHTSNTPHPQAERSSSSDAWVKVDPPQDVGFKRSVFKAVASEQVKPQSVEEAACALATIKVENVPIPTKTPPEKTEPPKKGPSGGSILAAGLKFAKSRQTAYGTPTIGASIAQERKEPPPVPKKAIDSPDQTKATDMDLPGVSSGQLRLDLTPSSMEFTLASPAAVAAAAIATARMQTQEDAAAEGNREEAIYFNAWGTPEERERPAAQKRKLTIFGDPSWDSAPSPSFIADLVFGGPLEQIRCTERSAEVTFLHAADAQTFFDATPNGILFRKDGSRSHYAEVKWVEDVTPMSSVVQQHIDSGATRCVHAIGLEDVPIELLKVLAGGKTGRLGLPTRKVESVEKGVSARGHLTATFRFCDIRDAVTFKAEMARDEDWEAINMQYATDPCAEAKESRAMQKAAAMKASAVLRAGDGTPIQSQDLVEM